MQDAKIHCANPENGSRMKFHKIASYFGYMSLATNFWQKVADTSP